MTRFSSIFLVLWIVALTAFGCAGPIGRWARGGAGEFGAGNAAGQPVTPAELDELTRAFADRYVGLLASTCEVLKKDNPDPGQRREAQKLMLNAATNVYDIASNADAFTRMLDLVVVTTLVSQVWVDDDRAGAVFGQRSTILIRSLHHARVEAWALAARVHRPDHLDVLDYTIWDWRRQNPDMIEASFVRFSNFALERGRSANAEVLAAGGFFKNIGQTGQAVDEARLLTERMFYRLKREPTLLRWQAEAVKDDLLATPEVGNTLADVRRFTDQVEQLPRNVATERQALLAALDERMKAADGTIGRLGAAIADAKSLVASLGQTGGSLDEMLKTADGLFTRYDAWDRWSTSRPDHRAFDVREFTQGVKELAVTVHSVDDVLKSSNELLASPEWGQRIGDVNRSVDGRIKLASEQSQLLVHVTFVRACAAMVILLAVLVLYRLTSLLLARRLGRVAAGGAGNGDGSAPVSAVASARGKRDFAITLLVWVSGVSCALHVQGGCAAPPATTSPDLRTAPSNGQSAAAPVRSDQLPPYVPVAGLSGKVTIIGASTTTHLIARAAVEFRRLCPGVVLDVTAGATSIGATALVEGRADVVPMSRPLLPDEVEAFRSKYGYPPTEIKVAADPLAIYVEKRNPVPGLTLTQMDGIFSQTRRRGGPSIETWGQAGLTGEWAGRPIALYGYGPSDGVHHVFRQIALAGGEYRLSMQVVPAGSLIVQDIAADPSAIGCASIFFASTRTRAVPIAGDDGLFYAPTDAASVQTGRYPLVRFVTICVNKPQGRPLAPATAEFLRFLLSAEGQQIVAAGGHVPLDPSTAARGTRAIE
jgi:phosphate transport system substrate-binding protein